MSVEIIPIRSPRIIGFGESVYESFKEAVEQNKFEIKDGDVIAITSKVYSMEQNSAVWLDDVVPTDQAKVIGIESSMDPRVVQLVIDESDGEIIGSVFHAILAKTPYGLSANAGIDLSNCPRGYALLLPRNPNEVAEKFRKNIRDDFGKEVVVIITDSRTIPLRRGTTAIAIGIAGMEPIIDERGNKDLYGYTMSISTRAIADNAASCANVVMGETNERTPFAIVRGLEYKKGEDQTMLSTLMPEDQCLYFAPLLKLIEKSKNN